jgi:hypothetical protein
MVEELLGKVGDVAPQNPAGSILSLELNDSSVANLTDEQRETISLLATRSF